MTGYYCRDMHHTRPYITVYFRRDETKRQIGKLVEERVYKIIFWLSRPNTGRQQMAHTGATVDTDRNEEKGNTNSSTVKGICDAMGQK
jgi:hypothetical protein